MSVGRVLSRFVAAVVIGVGVFLASMALTLFLRTSDARVANEIGVASPHPPISLTLPSDAVVVTTTTNSTHS